MTRDDLALAVERHATSKLPDDDLLDIRTLGFRGEALPSIGAVARLSITTRHAERAARLGDRGRRRREVARSSRRRSARAPGSRCATCSTRRRRGSSSSRATAAEGEAIREVVRRLAMSRPDVAFTLAGEERAPVTWAAALPGAPGRLARLADILGAEFRANAVEMRGGRDGARGRGLRRAADAHARQFARPVSLRQRPAGARQAPDRRGARAPMPTTCRATAIRSWRCSSRSIRARSTSTCIRPRPRCASAIPASCARC